jgi:Zn-finger nucleic acid-binding protein
MICPACGNTLEEVDLGGLCVDVCRNGCGGIWFDNFELQKVDESHESLGESLLNIEVGDGIVVDREKKRNCPKCQGIVMLKHFFGVKCEIEIDECGKCGGFFLDSGELSAIRRQFASEDERKAAEQDYFTSYHDQLRDMLQQDYQKNDKVKSFASMFRLLCPSYYVPGKQGWGAF